MWCGAVTCDDEVELFAGIMSCWVDELLEVKLGQEGKKSIHKNLLVHQYIERQYTIVWFCMFYQGFSNSV